MPRDPTRLTLLAALTGALVTFCGGDALDVASTTTCTQAAVTGEPTIDRRFPAVGTIAGCTATLVAPDVVLFAAHCLGPVAQGCRSVEDTVGVIRFTVAPSGCVADAPSLDCVGEVHTYGVADIATHPRSYDYGAPARCPASAPATYRCGAELTDESNLYAAFDVALARLHVASRVLPSSIATPMRVVTSLSDDTPSAYTVHRRVDTTALRAPSGCARPRASIVGWGGNTLGVHARFAGTMDFFDGEAWDRACQSVSDCGREVWTPFCPLEARAGAFEVEALPMHRGSTSPSAFDLGYVEPGDSGGPLVVHGGAAPYAIPELGDGDYVIGVLSLGANPTVASRGTDLQALYAATFEPSNARFIEETLARFAEDAARDSVLPLPMR